MYDELGSASQAERNISQVTETLPASASANQQAARNSPDLEHGQPNSFALLQAQLRRPFSQSLCLQDPNPSGIWGTADDLSIFRDIFSYNFLVVHKELVLLDGYLLDVAPSSLFQSNIRVIHRLGIATRLLSGTGRTLLEFTQHRYCAVLREDAPTSSDVIAVVANHKDGASVRYSITGGNRDGLFTIDQKTGLITLAAALDYELYDKHELVVSGEGGGQVVHTIVQVSVADVNDNPPVFLNPDPHVTVIEEDDRHLPTTLIKVDAKDPDLSDEYGLLYTLQGDGVDGFSAEDAFFSINPRSGDLMQLRALDRDPPNGKRIWKLRVKVQDGHDPWKGGKRPKGTKNTSMKSSDQSPPWDYENGFQSDQPVGDTLETDYDISELATQIHEVPEQQQYISFKWDSLKTQEDEIKSRLWEAKDNGYDKLVSLQNGGGSTRKNAWTLERSRKYKGRSLFWANSNDRSHSWKFKEIGNKDTKRLSWNDQTRFGIPKSVYNYKNEDNSHKNSWELSKRVRDEKINDRLVSRPETKISNSEELDEATDWGISNRISNIGDHTWHVNRLRESLGDSTSKRTSEGKRSKVENKASQKVVQKQGMKEKISSSKARPGELRVASRTAPSIGNKAQTLDQNPKILTSSSNATMVVNDKEGEPTGDKGKLKNFRKSENGGNPENTNSKRNFQNCNSSCKGDNSRSDYIPDTQNEKQVRQTSQSSWSSSLKTRIKLSNVKKQSEIVTRSDSSPYYLIPVDKFRDPHVPRNTNFKDATSNWKEMKNSDNDQFTQETKSGIKTKRSSDELLKIKQRVSKEELETSSSTRVHYLKSKQRSLDQLKLDPHNSIEKDNIERVSQQSTKSLESHSWKQLSVNDETKRKPTDSLIQHNGDSSVREVSTYNTPHPIESIASLSKIGEYSENLKTIFLKTVLNEPIISSKLSDRQIAGSTSRASSNKVSNKMGDVVKYSDIDSTYVLNQHSNIKFLSDLRLKGDSFVPPIKNFLPALAAQNRQIRSSNKNYKFGVKKPESKWVLKRPKGKGWLSRGARDTLFDSHFDNFDLDEEECYESLPDDAGKHKKPPVHEVEMMVTVIVKDINDNAPIFPNVTMFGDVQENGPVDLSVAEVSAWDADDATEGTNARITYAIEKNVIHDKSGEAIFNVDPNSGLVTTALCCLDRETTPEYHIQVVAADGGGLKGTGTVVVRLTDENDNSPRLARQYWELEVDETWGDGPPDNLTLLEMTAADPDTKNHFSYKIVEESGWGWDHFGIRSTGASGQLYALKKLDFEDDTHRQGFKFMVQVTDRGDGGWVDPRHQDTAWVGVRLRDLNDNPPQFVRPHAHVTISEDAPPGYFTYYCVRPRSGCYKLYQCSL
ncbi:protocadherin Fat 4-like [Palaemon carinicauda]|uniref:protocadherin Fat 4-like n=1 Tax=Palaemon carinicauda TaxID=392227 RepID=UPI0035B5BC70